MRTLTDVELGVVSGGNNGHGWGRGGRRFEVEVGFIAAKQTATSTATATGGSNTISNTHGPLVIKGDLVLTAGDATATASSENNINQTV